VAADRPHVAKLRRRDERRRLRERGVSLAHLRVLAHRGERRVRADAEPRGEGTLFGERGARAVREAVTHDTSERDDDLGLEWAPLHLRVHVGPSGDVHRGVGVLGAQRNILNERRGRDVAEARQAKHQVALRLRSRSSVDAVSRRTARFGSPLPLVRPVGPMRSFGTPRLSRFPSASRIFSAVIGVSSKRTPIASYTAFAIAGITGLSGPSPASFAPKGPSLSIVSTRIASSAGVSRLVGSL